LGLYEIVSSKTEIEFIKSLNIFPIQLSHIGKYALQIRKLELSKNLQAKHREAIEELQQINGTEKIDYIFGISEGPINDFATDLSEGNKPVRIFSEAKEYLDHLVDNKCTQKGISTGFPVYDQIIGGGQRKGSVNLIVARVKSGKTTYAKQVALNVAEQGIPVLMLDTEMGKEDQINRSIASKTKVGVDLIETGRFADSNKKDAVYKYVEDNKDLPFYYQAVAGKPFEEILLILKRWISQEVGKDENGELKDCLIIYDYFKLMDESALADMQEYQAMGFQISKLTDFCNINQAACLAFVQANRTGIDKEDASIVSQSDRLTWVCGSAVLLKRKLPEEIANDGLQNGNTKMVSLECTRYGAGLDFGDYINMRFDGDISLFEELGTRSNCIQATRVANNGFLVEEDEGEDGITG